MVVLGITHPGKWERESLATPIHFNNEGKDSTSLNKVSLPEENNKIKRLLIGKVFIIISSVVEPLIMYSVYYILSPSLHTEQSMAIASISVSSILSSNAHASLTYFCFVSRHATVVVDAPLQFGYVIEVAMRSLKLSDNSLCILISWCWLCSRNPKVLLIDLKFPWNPAVFCVFQEKINFTLLSSITFISEFFHELQFKFIIW